MAERLRLAQCLRCKGFTLLSTDGVLAWACDVSPATRDGYIAAIVGRKATYDVGKRRGGAQEARSRPLGTPAPPFGPGGAQEAAESLVHVEHSCGAGAKDQRPVAVTDPKASRPVTPGVPRAGSRPPLAPASGASSSSAAGHANVRLSSVYGRCGICDRMVKPGEEYWSIVHGHIWIDGEHVDCP